MSTSITEPAHKPAPPRALPPLESGDRLTRDEFERRYEAMPDLKKAELVEGVVYLPSPVRSNVHAAPHADLIGWLGFYRSGAPGLTVSVAATVRVDADNEVQPDALLMIDRPGGQAEIDDEDYVAGAPEFVAEISASSASIDLNAKFEVYRRNGVREYLVWRTFDHEIDWFVLRGVTFERLPPDGAGLLRSEVFPGLWLDPAALLRGDLAGVLKHLQDGMATPEHAAFVAKLRPATQAAANIVRS